MPNQTMSIANVANDDGWMFAGSPQNNNTLNAIGHFSGQAGCDAWYRFKIVTNIPQSSIINSCTFRQVGFATDSSTTFTARVKLEKVANAADITNGAQLDGRTFCSDKPALSDISVTVDVNYDVDLATAFQELINYTALTANDYVLVTVEDQGSSSGVNRRFKSRDDADHSKLLVDWSINYSETATGGIRFGGAATFLKESNHTATGGIVFGTGITPSVASSYGATGGILFGGETTPEKGYPYTATGGIEFGGDATLLKDSPHTATGGIEFGGEVVIGYEETATGGIEFGGDVGLIVTYEHTSTGGIEFGGDATLTLGYENTATGGIEFGGDAGLIVNYEPESTGGIEFGGEAITYNSYNETATGGIEFGGRALYDVIDMNGDIVCGGEAEFSCSMYWLLPSSWDIEGEVSLSFSSSWNTGETPLQWYRIEGECTSATCSTLGVDPNDEKCGTGTPDGAKFLTTIAARGLTDLCEKLKDPALFPPVVTKIQSIKKYSRPVQKQEKTIVSGSEGLTVLSSGPDPNPECNILIEQPITTCIQEISEPSSLQTTQIGFYMQVFTTAYEFEMSGGINMGGEATYTAPNYTFDMTGGIVISGEAQLDFWYGTILGAEATAELSVIDLTVMFAEVDAEDNLSIDDGTVTVDCGCGPLPLTLILRHNLTKANYLSNFFKRNNITFEDIITLRYNANTTSWRGHLHYIGDGNYNTRERWNMFFEWACTDSSGADTWRLYVFINRKDLATSEDSETRVSFTIPTDFACTDKRIHFKSELDTRNGLVTLRKGFADEILYNDSIGLFKNRLWAARPLLTFEINQNDQQGTLQRYDLKPIFPVDELNLEN